MRILAWSLDQILEEVKRLEGEQKILKTEVSKICWYMRGGLTYDEAFALSYDDRQVLGSIIKENLEVTKKSGLPFF